jgi:hypothetical protein
MMSTKGGGYNNIAVINVLKLREHHIIMYVRRRPLRSLSTTLVSATHRPSD